MEQTTIDMRKLSINSAPINIGQVDLKRYLNAKNLSTKDSHMNLLYQFVLDNVNYGQLCSDISVVEYNRESGSIYEKRPPELRRQFNDDVIFVKLIQGNKVERFNYAPEPLSLFMTQMHRWIREFKKEEGEGEHDESSYASKLRAVRTSVFKTWSSTIDMSEIGMYRTTKKFDEVKIEAIERGLRNTIGMATNRLEEFLIDHPKYIEAYKSKHNMWSEKGIGYIAVKMSMSHWDLETSLKFIDRYRNAMAEEDIFLYQFDLTTDLGCSFDKECLERYLVSIDHMPKAKNSYMNSVVGANCVLYRIGDIRYKVYNKFAQSLESHSVGFPIGNHVHNWINNFEAPIRESIRKSIPVGFTRVELSFYGPLCEGKLERHIDDLENYLDILAKSGQLFECGIQKQWNAFCDMLTTGTVFVLDQKTHEYVLGMWCHRQMGRIAGTCGKFTSDQWLGLDAVIKYVVAHYSMPNLPMYVIQFVESDQPYIMGVQAARYMKDETKPLTLVWNGKYNGLFYDASQTFNYDDRRFSTRPRENKPEEMGMAKNEAIELHIPEERARIRRTCISEAVLDNTNMHTDYHLRAALIDAELELNSQDAIRNRLANAMYSGTSCSLLNEKTGTTHEVFALKRYGTRYGCKYTMITGALNRLVSNEELTGHINSVIESENIVLNRDLYYHQKLEYIFKFTIGPERRDSKNNRCKTIISFELNPTFADPNIEPSFVEISSSVKHIDSVSINTLSEGYVLHVMGMKFYDYRKVRKVMLLSEGVYYNSNFFLEEALTEMRYEPFDVIIGPTKSYKKKSHVTVMMGSI